MVAGTDVITLKNLALIRRQLRDSTSTNQIARLVNYFCHVVTFRFDGRVENTLTGLRYEAVILPLMTAEHRACFFTVLL